MQMNVPQIESKNLTILEDQMNHEALCYKKASLYAQQFTDPALKNMAGQMAQHHKMHFDSLYQYLSSHQ